MGHHGEPGGQRNILERAARPLWATFAVLGSIAVGIHTADTSSADYTPDSSVHALEASSSASESTSPLLTSTGSPEPSISPSMTSEQSPTAAATLTEVPTLTSSAPPIESEIPTPVATVSDIVTPSDLPTTEPIPAANMAVGAFNIYYNSNDRDPEYSKVQWRDRLSHSVYVIKKYLDIAGLQEVREDQWQLLQSNEMLGGQYGIFPKEYSSYAAQNPIVWKLEDFEYIHGQTINGPHVTEAGVIANSATMVKLRNKATDRMIILINSHEPVGGSPEHPTAPQARFDNANYKAELYKQLRADHPDAIIIFTGDWNSNYNAHPDDKQPTLGNDPQNTAYCIMVRAGLSDSLDAFEHKGDESQPTNCQPRDVPRVDHIYIGGEGWKVLSDQYGGGENDEMNHHVPGGPILNGSDVHNTLDVEMSVKPLTHSP